MTRRRRCDQRRRGARTSRCEPTAGCRFASLARPPTRASAAARRSGHARQPRAAAPAASRGEARADVEPTPAPRRARPRRYYHGGNGRLGGWCLRGCAVRASGCVAGKWRGAVGLPEVSLGSRGPARAGPGALGRRAAVVCFGGPGRGVGAGPGRGRQTGLAAARLASSCGPWRRPPGGGRRSCGRRCCEGRATRAAARRAVRAASDMLCRRRQGRSSAPRAARALGECRCAARLLAPEPGRSTRVLSEATR